MNAPDILLVEDHPVNQKVALRVLEQRVGKRFGGSTGTDFCGALQLACELRAQGQAGSIVTLACEIRLSSSIVSTRSEFQISERSVT